MDFTVDVGGGGGATGGETCDAPIAVTSLPYDDAGNTADYGNNYSNGDVPPIAPDAVKTGTGSAFYLSGDEVVYAYTPTENEVLNISTTNDDDWIGLWAFTGCPFASTVGYHTSTSGGTRLIEELPVTAGETYYFVISTWAPPQSTDYTIHIEKVGGGGGGGFVCDDQFNVTNGIENGLFFGGSTNQKLAVDIVVGDEGFTANGSNLNIFLDPSQTTGDITFNFTFYTDQGGAPGSAVHSSLGTVTSTEFVGSNFGYDVHTFEVSFDDAADFDANTTYWMEVDSNGVAWESTTAGIFGAGLAFFNDSTGGDWVVDATEDLVYSLICDAGTGGGGTACEQVFFDADQPTAIGFASGNKVANDITVAAGESFTLQTMTFDVVTIDGLPNEFDLEIFEDNGSGGVGTSTGITHHFDSSNMTFVENGTFSIYTQYTVTFTLPEIELTADASEDARYWLAIAS